MARVNATSANRYAPSELISVAVSRVAGSELMHPRRVVATTPEKGLAEMLQEASSVLRES